MVKLCVLLLAHRAVACCSLCDQERILRPLRISVARRLPIPSLVEHRIYPCAITYNRTASNRQTRAEQSKLSLQITPPPCRCSKKDALMEPGFLNHGRHDWSWRGMGRSSSMSARSGQTESL